MLAAEHTTPIVFRIVRPETVLLLVFLRVVRALADLPMCFMQRQRNARRQQGSPSVPEATSELYAELKQSPLTIRQTRAHRE
jgi:hypothetical protein